jgi:ferrous iron transport protein A
MLNQNGNLPLAMVGAGQMVKLVKVAAGRVLCRRLAEMGLTPGVHLEVLQDQGGPLLLAVRDSRLALGRGMAQKIIVETQ